MMLRSSMLAFEKVYRLDEVLHDFFEKLHLPKCNRKCYTVYKQTFILLKIQAEMVENNFLANLNSASIYSSYNIV